MEHASTDALIDLTARIYSLRGVRIMLDADLANIYGVSTKRLNEQVKRNAKRFPLDFAFVLTAQELTSLRSQNATANPKRRTGTQRPIAFTEHGALMAANVLKSDRAAEMSVFVIRAFVRMREILAGNTTLSEKLNELEKRVSGHDGSIAEIISAVRQLIQPAEAVGPKREIGFHVKNSRNKFKAI